MSSYGHILVPKRGILVPIFGNLAFFVPKPNLKVLIRDFFFYQKFCLIEILKFWKRLGPQRCAFFTILKNMKITKTVKIGLKHLKQPNELKNLLIHTMWTIYIFGLKSISAHFYFITFFSILIFFKQYFLGILHVGLKTAQNCKMLSKNGQNDLNALFLFIFHHKKSTFWRWPFSSDLWHGIALKWRRKYASWKKFIQ